MNADAANAQVAEIGTAPLLPMAEIMIPNDLEVATGSKAFFSEEKKQKTFANSDTCTTRTVRDSN